MNYFRNDNVCAIYTTPPIPADKHWPAAGCFFRHLYMLYRPGLSIKSLRLARDRVVGGADCYVLEVRLREQVHGKSFNPFPRLYLGKKDLLPRRIEESSDEAERAPGVPRDVFVTVFSGIVANPKLPDKLFIMEPPEHAKLYGSYMALIKASVKGRRH
jgi:hypothetical protein